MGNPLNVGELDTKVAELLNAELEASPLSLRQLSELSGVKKTRLGDILRRGKAMTVAELDSIAAVFNLKGWKLLRKATEALTSAPSSVSSLDEYREYSEGTPSGEELEATAEGVEDLHATQDLDDGVVFVGGYQYIDPDKLGLAAADDTRAEDPDFYD